jgi:LemA protein
VYSVCPVVRSVGLMVKMGIMKNTRRAALTLVIALAATPLAGCSYNRFVGQEEAIKSQWAQVENQLQRRNDLIPNLVETVKGYAQHEEGVFKEIADARSRLLAAKSPEEPFRRPTSRRRRGRLLAVVGAIRSCARAIQPPHGRASGTENRIVVERMRYNERVQR